MRLHVLSDIHLEHAPMAAPEVEADLVVLAGDIAPGTAGINWAGSWLRDRPGLYIAGNHEFYGHTLPALVEDLRVAATGSAVQVLERDEVVIGGVRFLGCSLWTDFDFAGGTQRQRSMSICERMVNDYKYIRVSETDRLLRTEDTRQLHLESRAWLTERLEQPHAGPTVVVTHHSPVVRSRPRNPVLAAIGSAFASDLTELMGADRVDLWIFGHTHRVVDVEIAGTRVISNQRGYPHDLVEGFDPLLVVDV